MSSRPLAVVSDFSAAGDQPAAIEQLIEGIEAGLAHQTLLGVTGSGKTFTMANIVERVQRPTLVIAPNKTLAAQLATEFKEYFADNPVEYFVSYYDYYQPEAYIPRTDLYIEKDADINEEIDKLRHSATRALLSRRDVLIVASVSCIYGLGDPAAEYHSFVVNIQKGERRNRNKLVRHLVDMQYERKRHGASLGAGSASAATPWKSNPPSEEGSPSGWSSGDDEIERMSWKFDPLTGEILRREGAGGRSTPRSTLLHQQKS